MRDTKHRERPVFEYSGKQTQFARLGRCLFCSELIIFSEKITICWKVQLTGSWDGNGHHFNSFV